MRRALYRFYWKAERLITPQLRSSQYVYCEALRRVLSRNSRWLDLGCGHQVFAEWMTREQREVVDTACLVVGIDEDWRGLREHPAMANKVFGNVMRLPFRSASYDVVTANMVVEHLPDPAVVLEEVRRVLAPDGVFVFHTPNYYHWGTLVAACMPSAPKNLLIRVLDGRVEKDVFPTHYRMNTASEIRRLAAHAGFDVIDLRQVSTSAALAVLGPLALVELLYIRLLQRDALAHLRSNLVVTLRRRAD